MSQAKNGDKVSVHYKGTLADETLFDSSEGRDPLEFTLGSGQVIPGFDSAVSGLSIGESVKVDIPAAEAYGERNAQLIQVMERKMLPPDIEPEVGQEYMAMSQTGQQVTVVVVDVSDDSVTLDANHPLAGKDLTFEIELVKIG